MASLARFSSGSRPIACPSSAAINGWCLGGGLELASVCDIRIASTEAKFVCSGVNVGLMASAYRLPRLIGVARAKHMLLTGSPHDAATAERFGLVTAVHAPEALMAEAVALAERIAGPRAALGGSDQAHCRNGARSVAGRCGEGERQGTLRFSAAAPTTRKRSQRSSPSASRCSGANKPVPRLDRRARREHGRQAGALQAHVIAQHTGGDRRGNPSSASGRDD